MIWYDNVMLDEIIQRHAYNNNSNTSQLNTKQNKARQDKTWWNIHILVAYNDNDNDNDNNNNDNHYSMNSDDMKIIS